MSWSAIWSAVKGCLSKAWKFRCRLFRKKSMENKTYRLGYDLTVFLDVQGQREKSKVLRLPKTPDEHAAVQEVLKDTAGFVVGLRDAFRRNVEAFEAGISRKKGEHLQRRFVRFSDSFVVSVPLKRMNGDMRPLVRISSELSSTSTLVMAELASDDADREGIEVGVGRGMWP